MTVAASSPPPQNPLLEPLEPLELAVHGRDWFHAGQLPDGIYASEQHYFRFFHVGSRDAADERISPKQQSGSWNEDWCRAARIYRITIAPDARICPHAHRDEWGDEDNSDGMNAGAENFDGSACGGEYDVHLYRNGYEDAGSVSAAVNPEVATVAEDLGPHPGWARTPRTQSFAAPGSAGAAAS